MIRCQSTIIPTDFRSAPMTVVISRPDLVIQNLAVLTKPPTIIRQRVLMLSR